MTANPLYHFGVGPHAGSHIQYLLPQVFLSQVTGYLFREGALAGPDATQH
jgi:hypothetical protein